MRARRRVWASDGRGAHLSAFRSPRGAVAQRRHRVTCVFYRDCVQLLCWGGSCRVEARAF